MLSRRPYLQLQLTVHNLREDTLQAKLCLMYISLQSKTLQVVYNQLHKASLACSEHASYKLYEWDYRARTCIVWSHYLSRFAHARSCIELLYVIKEIFIALNAADAVLCCAVLCCAVLCCAVLCCAVLCCAVLCCAVLCCAVLCCAVLKHALHTCISGSAFIN